MPEVFRLFRSVAICAALMAHAAPSLALDTDFILVTEEEAAEAARFSDEVLDADDPPAARSAVAGAPRIVVQAPRLDGAVAPPIEIRVEFRPESGAQVRMETLAVKYRIGPVWTDITNRLHPHATIRGNVLTARGAGLPAGRHRLRVEITDSAGRVGVAAFAITISG